VGVATGAAAAGGVYLVSSWVLETIDTSRREAEAFLHRRRAFDREHNATRYVQGVGAGRRLSIRRPVHAWSRWRALGLRCSRVNSGPGRGSDRVLSHPPTHLPISLSLCG
jgi:hypothetical protein